MEVQELRQLLQDAGVGKALSIFPPTALQDVKLIGRGGVCEVHKARLVIPGVGNLAVALSVPYHTSKYDIRAFMREIRHAFEAAAACNSVCPVLGASLLEGRPVMLMPLYEISVHELTQEEHPNGMPPELAMRIASAAARALLPLHAKGLVHTNLKPLKFLMNGGVRGSPLRDIVISGFELAMRADDEDDDEPHIGQGTCAYMAPEQHSSEVGPIGPASDVWALGVSMIHMLTGAPPTGGKSINAMFEQLVTQKAPPAVPDSLPADLRALVGEMLRINPDERPKTAEVAMRLEKMIQAASAKK